MNITMKVSMAVVIVRVSMVKVLSFIAIIMVMMCSSPIYGIEKNLDFHTINMRNGLSHNTEKALYGLGPTTGWTVLMVRIS